MEGTRKLLWKVTELDGVEESKRVVIEFLGVKLVQLIHLMDDFGRFFNEKAGQLFPPETQAETLHRWVHVGLTVVFPFALALFFAVFYYSCRWGCFAAGMLSMAAGNMMKVAGKMMKAPGRGGRLFHRASLNLRAGKGLVY